MFLAACGAFSAFQIILSWVNSTIARPKSKRAVAVALATAIANWYGPRMLSMVLQEC